MRSFTFFFKSETFAAKRAATSRQVIDYVASRATEPFKRLRKGDEIFIVGVQEKRVRLAGRMIIGDGPMSREEAERKTGRKDFLDKPQVCLADPQKLDYFRTNLLVPIEVMRSLDLHNADGSPTKTESLVNEAPTSYVFSSCPELSKDSADQLRSLLGIESCEVGAVDESAEPEVTGLDDEEYRDRTIKTRRGQPKFREALLRAYGSCCMVTKCRIEGLLEAAHITPHAAHTDYRVSNGLLLRADIHTLFDLNLLCIDDFYKIKVSEQLKHSEYWMRYHGVELTHFPEKMADFPNRDALAVRAKALKK